MGLVTVQELWKKGLTTKWSSPSTTRTCSPGSEHSCKGREMNVGHHCAAGLFVSIPLPPRRSSGVASVGFH
jgi:hypothetical protein